MSSYELMLRLIEYPSFSFSFFLPIGVSYFDVNVSSMCTGPMWKMEIDRSQMANLMYIGRIRREN